jgi:hypothetical protein
MEIGRSVDQRRTRIERFLAEHRDALSRQGVVVPTYRHRDGRTLGPFFQLRCRIEGRQIAIYLGTDEELIRLVRGYLSRLQRQRLEGLQLAELRRALRRRARLARQSLDAELEQMGLRRQGNEIRGWRSKKQVEAVASLNMLSTREVPKTSDSQGGS